MDWLIYLGISSLLTYEIVAALTGISHTISEWFWRLFKRKPWTRWAVLGVLIIFTLHIVFELWGYADPRIPDVSSPTNQEDCCDQTCY